MSRPMQARADRFLLFLLRAWAASLIAAACFAPAGLSAVEPPKGEAFRYDAQNRRDPFTPLVRDGRLIGSGGRTGEQLGQPMLHGILWDVDGHSIALIDDAEVRVGDSVGGYEVREIRQDGVVLKHGEKTVVLTIAFEAVGPEATMGGTRP